MQISRRQGAPEKTRYLHSDRLGSVDAISDAASSLVAKTKRDPFGNIVTDFNQPALAPPGAGSAGDGVRLGFTGQEQDDDLGLINLNARMYDPLLGRFLTPDPVLLKTDEASYNRYNYAYGNPLLYIDPTGMLPPGTAGPGELSCYTDSCRYFRECQQSPRGCLVETAPPNPSGSPACDASGACAPGTHGNGDRGSGGTDAATGNASTSQPTDDKSSGASSAPGARATEAGSSGEIFYTDSDGVGYTAADIEAGNNVVVDWSAGMFTQMAVEAVAWSCVIWGCSSSPFSDGRPPGSFGDRVARRTDELNDDMPGGPLVLGISRKQALNRIAGLAANIEHHLGNLGGEPHSQAANHWKNEIRANIAEIDRLSGHTGAKTAAHWAEQISAWTRALGGD